MSRECTGCKFNAASYPDYCMFGLIPHIEMTDGCPCQVCLIKSMCERRIVSVARQELCDGVCKDFMLYVYGSRSLKSFHEVMQDFANNHLSSYTDKGE